SANLIAEVRPQVGGIIQKRLFTEGTDVKAGQPLFQIDPALYQVALDNARAGLARSEAQLSTIQLRETRMKDLLADKAVSKQDYDDAAAALKQVQADIQYGKASVEAAQINLKYTTITAPISGRIGRSNVTEGALVTAHQPLALATIQKIDPMYVDVTQSTSDILKLRRQLQEGQLSKNGAAQQVRLILDDNSEYPWKGKLQFQDVTVDPTTGSVVLRMVFPNPKGMLLPGMFVRAIIQEGVHKNAMLLPQQAVFRDPKGNPLTFIVDQNGKVEQRTLKLDRAIGDAWLVSSGITAGERVIIEGMQKVRPGINVKTVPFEKKEKSGGTDNFQTPPSKTN
ncbi:MAG: efflux RND transporter periplasmic adaptor subunit, partial [Deltaproteobacteria bacterium]|nr:efflux RND transporter periplasmic adaptor subunit [Deltaproteobacteria bacterium]